MAQPLANTNENLSAYLDGELTDAEIAEFEAELARDPELRAELDAFEGVAQWLREEGPDQAPLGFHHRVMARIEEAHPERPSIWAWLRRPFGLPLEGWLVAGAAAAVLFLVIPKGSDPGTEEWGGPPVEGASPAAVKMPVMDPNLEVPAPGKGVPTPESTGKSAPVFKDAAPAPAPAPVAPAPMGKVTSAPDPAQGEAEASGGAPTVAETQGTDEETKGVPMASPGYSYVIRSTSPDMKLAVLQLAGRYGGAVDPAGAEVGSAEMSASSEQLKVMVAQPDLTRFAKELDSLGYELIPQKDQGLVKGDELIPVSITLQLVGGATGTPDAAPNAARKSKGADMLEAVEEEL